MNATYGLSVKHGLCFHQGACRSTVLYSSEVDSCLFILGDYIYNFILFLCLRGVNVICAYPTWHMY